LLKINSFKFCIAVARSASLASYSAYYLR